ncbi:MG2 domain-containing protein [Tenacibaculum sp. IB213877]|uniref:alpha-2-macroglobulin family protein n=1 Tax=Tenacibaculum sp. IB213877 TaxID=3097351 RepID=UPI002A5A7EE4|nr:MG2 domain-containing protein [Tenacibaculum sp. IB213877]MDY0779371.1 MG2 domain-containing protein [Tenacibaculum sp. IB213877]
MKKSFSLFLVLIVFSVFQACKKGKTAESNIQQFNEYVSVFPEKLVSVYPNIQFYLKKSVTISPLPKDVISIKPKVKGEVTLTDNTLSFKPAEKLKANTEYTITLHLSKLYDDIDEDLKDFTVKVKTKELLYNVSLQSPYVYDKNWNYVEGFLNASDVFETDQLNKVVKATYNGKNIPVKFASSSELASRVSFKIDSLQRFEDDKQLVVTWNGKPIQSTSKGDRALDITGKNNFKVLDVNVVNGNNQQIEISFSDPIHKSQDVKGLIQFVNSSKKTFTYKINNNVLTLFPSTEFKNKVDIEIFKGIKNTEGYSLKENYARSLYFEELKPQVSFIKSGAILPNSKNLKINFNAANLRAVDATIYKIYKNNVLQFLQNYNLSQQANLHYVGRPVAKYTINLSNQGLQLDKINAFAFDLADVIQVEEGAMYRVELSFNKEYSNYSCDGVTPNNPITFGKKEINEASFDRTGYYYDDYYEDYNWNEREDACTSSYYYNKKISTNILATNLGVIVKKGSNNTTFIAVTDILTTEPVQGAQVKLFNLQQQEVAKATTNNEGIATFTDVKPSFFAQVSKDKNTTYVRLEDGNALSMSKFDVSGTKLQKGIKGYIYGERGVWRPGDQLFLTFILNDKANPIPEKHPIKFELINPQGKIIDRAIQYKNTHNMYSYAPKTNDDALTGNWKLKVSVGGATFSKTLKIETIKPNRLKIKLATDKEVFTSNSPIKGNVEVKWLHGAIAKGLKLDINGKFRQTNTSFKGYEKYQFDDVTRRFGTEEFSVLQGNLNQDGTTSFSVQPRLDNKAPGMLQASFITKVYENGGDFSTDVFTKKVSPYPTYVGVQSPIEKESKNYLFTNENYTFDVATVNENGRGVGTNNLEVNVYKISWRWWWNTDDGGLSSYDGTRYHEPYKKFNIKTNASGKGQFVLKVDENDWGRYLVKVTDRLGKHTTSKIVYFDWPSWYGRKKSDQDKSNATMLIFTTDKEKYTTKEKAVVKFPSSAGARALLTIENGTEVLDHFWVNTTDKQTEFSFPILPKYTPNVYVNVSLLQPHSQTVNDLPIRMYGSMPILVENTETKLEPQIQLADELKPESKATIRVNEKNGKPMTYTIALVDEGLLDLTRFKTPNAWNTFYARQSLGVKTWDIFDDVIGAYGGKINQILSIGGDEAEAGSKNKKANRFKPMVTYLGPFNLKMGATESHEITIPKYIGSVRAMVVASNAEREAYGSDEKTAFVRKPVMVLASLPRKITPQETVTLPVTVFAMKPNIKNVQVTVKPNEAFTIEGNATQNVSFAQPDEKMAYFQLKINDFKGIGKVQVDASSGAEKASYEVEIDVLNPNPVTTETLDLVLKSGENSEINFKSFGTKGTNAATVELSTLPPMNFSRRLQYLIRYPHGCVEQTTSSVFPQLYLPELFDLAPDKRASVERNIKAAIQRLSDFQMSNGAMAYWQGGNYVSHWGTSYAGHFMLEASKKGYALPIGFTDKWIAYQKQAARNWRAKMHYDDDDLTQAYRLYTLTLANNADLASMNRLRETAGISNESKMRLASAYALIGKRSIAEAILKSLSTVDYTKNYYSGYGSETRNKAMSLETYTLMNNELEAIKLAKEVATNLSSDQWMSTQTTAYSLLAMSQYALQNGGSTGINASINLNGMTKDATTNKSLFSMETSQVLADNLVKINNKGNGVLYARVFNRGILPVGEEKIVEKNLSATVTFKSKDGSVMSPDNLSQGTNFIAEVTLKNNTTNKIENVALTQYIPSGWEIVNTRFTDFGNNTTSSQVDYTDIRDASISNYFTLHRNESKTFRVLLNASYLGDYYLPGIQAEAMYDNDYLVRTKGRWIKVVK